MDRIKFRYGVLSDKYGLHMDNEILDSYDVHPATLTDDEKRHLGKLIRTKILALSRNKIVFYNNSPARSTPYFQMLYYAEVESFFCTRLDFLTSAREGKEER